jgi:putative transposase
LDCIFRTGHISSKNTVKSGISVSGISSPARISKYPYHDKAIRVTECGRICIGRRKINLSRSFANQIVGIREVTDKIWLVSFMEFDLGFFDEDERRVEPAVNPFIPKVLPMSSV